MSLVGFPVTCITSPCSGGKSIMSTLWAGRVFKGWVKLLSSRIDEWRDVPYLLCVSVARTQLAITGPVLPEDGLLFNQSMTGWFGSFKHHETLASIYLLIFQVGNSSGNISCRNSAFYIELVQREATYVTQVSAVVSKQSHANVSNTTAATDCDISDHWPATFLAGELSLLTGWAFVARWRAGPACVAFVARFGAGRGWVRRVDDPGQRLVPPNVLLAFHDQDGPRLHIQ